MPVLVAQMGHYPRTTGATGTAGEQAMAHSVVQHLLATSRPGWTVRPIGADVPDIHYRGDYFVAVHGDGSANRATSGASVGWQNPEGRALAQRWKDAYRANGWPGIFRADNYTAALGGYYGVRKAIAQGNRNAIIIEVGFMTAPTDRAWIDANHAAIAASIWDAVAGPKEEPAVFEWIDAHMTSIQRDAALATAKQLGVKFIVRAGGPNMAIVSVHANKERGDAYVAAIHRTGVTDIRRYPSRSPADNTVRRLNAPTTEVL